VKFISSRELSTKPADVYSKLEKAGKLIINYNGKPKALMVSIDEDSFEGVLRAVTRALAEYALSDMRQTARDRGVDGMKERELEAVISDARRVKKK
jgi:hypothetical protein